MTTTPASGAADLPEALYADAVKFAKEKASISYVQRKCRCSYNKAERMLEQMVADCIIPTYNGRKDASLTAQAISAEPAGAGYAALTADHVSDTCDRYIKLIREKRAGHIARGIDAGADYYIGDVGHFIGHAVNDALRASHGQAPAQTADSQLLQFYGVTTDAELIAAQAAHIEKLQAKLTKTPSFAPQRVREG